MPTDATPHTWHGDLLSQITRAFLLHGATMDRYARERAYRDEVDFGLKAAIEGLGRYWAVADPIRDAEQAAHAYWRTLRGRHAWTSTKSPEKPALLAAMRAAIEILASASSAPFAELFPTLREPAPPGGSLPIHERMARLETQLSRRAARRPV